MRSSSINKESSSTVAFGFFADGSSISDGSDGGLRLFIVAVPNCVVMSLEDFFPNEEQCLLQDDERA